jgi:ribonuclease Y
VAILEPTTVVIVLIVALLLLVPLAGFAGIVLQRRITARHLGDVAQHGQRVLEEAERNAETRLKDAAIEAKEVVYRARTELEQEIRERQKEIQTLERRLSQKEEQVSRRLDQFDRRDRDYHAREEGLRTRELGLKEIEARHQALVDEQRRQLERMAGMTAEEAKQRLLGQMEEEARREATLLAMRLEEEAKESAERKSREILATTIQRLAPDYTVETAVSIVDLPSDDMKGRIIGREGRNIRALELATGVDLIVDDTPEAVIISGYDPLRREIAKVALERLITDGRIHPARIEEVVDKVKKEMEQHLKEEGERACFEVGVHGLHAELVRMVGRLRYRTSYGQNCLQHSKEVAWLAGMMAAEVGADVKLAKRCGLLHDIGKALTHEQEGSHVELSVELLTKYNEPRAVLNTILSGHDEAEPETVEAVLVEAADGVSAARPGARRDVLESYIKRVKAMEDIARSFKGVEAAYAIQAGRELRIITKADQISDLDTYQLAKDVAKRIEAEMQYPGHIKVTVIREHRATELAR